jgi:hypothetical protein
MRVILQIFSGPAAGKTVEVKPGSLVRIGRTERADFSFPADAHMSGVHFGVEFDGKVCRLHDYRSTNGTQVNGERVETAVLQDGDRITAGESAFMVRIETESKVSMDPVAAGHAALADTRETRLLSLFRDHFQPLYALLDAAREPSVLKVLVESGEDLLSLFASPEGSRLAHFAPYLVVLRKDSALLERLVYEGWGKSWGIFLTCDRSAEELRSHLRQFLKVRLPGHREVYFRYYDPRVLRLFLPTCYPDEINRFFGPIRYILMEDEKGQTLLRFSNSGQGVGLKSFPLI